jgi:hypothetical protein
MLTYLRISIDAMPWQRENRARCKRPADIEVSAFATGGHMQQPALNARSPPHHPWPSSTVLPHARSPPPDQADMTVAGYTDHGSQRRSYRRSSGW